MADEEVEIQVSVPKQLLETLLKSFKSDDVKTLGKIAFVEFAHWLTSDQRFATIPDLEAHRVWSIYNEILNTKLPSPEELSSALNMIPSRGEYIAHSIRFQHSIWWKNRLVKTALQNCRDATPQKNDKDTLRVTTDPACQIIFDQIFLNLADTDNIVPPKGKRVLGYLQYQVGVNLLPKVIAALEAESNKLTSGESGG